MFVESHEAVNGKRCTGKKDGLIFSKERGHYFWFHWFTANLSSTDWPSLRCVGRWGQRETAPGSTWRPSTRSWLIIAPSHHLTINPDAYAVSTSSRSISLFVHFFLSCVNKISIWTTIFDLPVSFICFMLQKCIYLLVVFKSLWVRLYFHDWGRKALSVCSVNVLFV